MQSLTGLANASATDKGTQATVAHGYSLVYDCLFAPLRQKSDVNLLEMGLAVGRDPENTASRVATSSPSLEMWTTYFNSPHLVGFDISDFSSLEKSNLTFIRGDGGNRADLERIAALNKRFDIIIDDASHASYHQQLGLSVLFPLLKPGGLYVIEDLHWQPMELERTLPNVPKTAKWLADFVATGKLETTAAVTAADAKSLEETVLSTMLFEEGYLNAQVAAYNRKYGMPTIERLGWRGTKSRGARLLRPGFWRFSARRFAQGLETGGCADWRATKLAVLQKGFDAPLEG